MNQGGQLRFWQERQARIKGLFGGRGSAKTTSGALEALRQIQEQPGLPGAIVAPDYPSLVKSTLPEFLEWVPEGAIVDQSKAEKWYLFRNGSRVYYSGIDDPESWRGPNLAWLWFDESGKKKTNEAWLVLLGCVRIGAAKMWTTSTPKGKTHWLHDVFVKNPKPGIHWHTFASSRDNADNLDPLFIETLEASYTGAWREQELEGKFVELQGTVFDRTWFDIVPEVPDDAKWVRFWDLAVSVRQSADYTVGGLVGLADGDIYIKDITRLRSEWPDARRRIIEAAHLDGTGVKIGVENVGFQLAAIQELRRDDSLLGHTIREARPDRDKLARAMPWAARAEAGRVHLVEGPWNNDFLNEVCDFPQGSHEDQVDAVSGAVAMLANRQILIARMGSIPGSHPPVEKPVKQERYGDWPKKSESKEHRQRRIPWRVRARLRG